MKYYMTVTSKGQVTLPVEVRRVLGLEQGSRVGVRLVEEGAVIEAAVDVNELRQQVRGELKAQGFTADRLREMAEKYKSGDGLAAALKDEYDQS